MNTGIAVMCQRVEGSGHGLAPVGTISSGLNIVFVDPDRAMQTVTGHTTFKVIIGVPVTQSVLGIDRAASK